MNIDARNLNLNNVTANNPKIASTSENKFEELMRNLSKSDDGIYIRQDSLASHIYTHQFKVTDSKI